MKCAATQMLGITSSSIFNEALRKQLAIKLKVGVGLSGSDFETAINGLCKDADKKKTPPVDVPKLLADWKHEVDATLIRHLLKANKSASTPETGGTTVPVPVRHV